MPQPKHRSSVNTSTKQIQKNPSIILSFNKLKGCMLEKESQCQSLKIRISLIYTGGHCSVRKCKKKQNKSWWVTAIPVLIFQLLQYRVIDQKVKHTWKHPCDTRYKNTKTSCICWNESWVDLITSLKTVVEKLIKSFKELKILQNE